MAKWELIAKDVKYTRHQPHEVFIADTYQCTSCHNRVSSRDELPKTLVRSKYERSGQ